jgi:crossover junction endodeoxyribonuclease RuvC
MIVGGIDPGMGGGLAVVNDHGDCETILMPSIDDVVDGAAALRFFTERDVEFVVIEKTNGNPKFGCTGNFSFGISTGAVRAVGQIICCTPRIVKPQEWKKAWSLLRQGKDASRLLAMAIFPKAQQQFQRVKDDGRAEAALIAAYHLNMHLKEAA